MRRSHGSWQAYRRQVVWSAPPFEKPKHAVRPTIGLATRFHRGRPSCERREIGLTNSDFALFWSEAKVRALPCLGSPPNELEPILARGCKSDRRAARTLRQVCSIDAQDRICPCAGFGRAFVRENSQEPRRREGGGCRSRLQRRQVSPVRSDIQSAARSPERTAHRRVRRFIRPASSRTPRARDRRRDKAGRQGVEHMRLVHRGRSRTGPQTDVRPLPLDVASDPDARACRAISRVGRQGSSPALRCRRKPQRRVRRRRAALTLAGTPWPRPWLADPRA